MKISEVQKALQTATDLRFQLPDGSRVPAHFHVTEVGVVSKHFIDCGGTVRTERKARFQLWAAHDHDHRLKPQKLLGIIALSEKTLGMDDLEVEVEYQGQDTISTYGLDFDGRQFRLTGTQTACLAPDRCGLPETKQKVQLSDLQNQTAGCTPGGGCC